LLKALAKQWVSAKYIIYVIEAQLTNYIGSNVAKAMLQIRISKGLVDLEWVL
jgi:hypothetical protein